MDVSIVTYVTRYTFPSLPTDLWNCLELDERGHALWIVCCGEHSNLHVVKPLVDYLHVSCRMWCISSQQVIDVFTNYWKDRAWEGGGESITMLIGPGLLSCVYAACAICNRVGDYGRSLMHLHTTHDQ